MKNKIILILLITLVIAFIGLEAFKLHEISDLLRLFLLPLLILLYYNNREYKNKYFSLFLILYAFAEIVSIVGGLLFRDRSFYIGLYFLGNTTYITAYSFLIFSILEKMNIKKVLNKYMIHAIILLLLDAYCVILITDITVSNGGFNGFSQYFMEIIYNIINMLLLNIALMNYISRDSKKSMNLLLGAIFITFSEVMQIAYYYVSDANSVNLISLFFLFLAFYFLYIQTKLSYNEESFIDNNKFNELNA